MSSVARAIDPHVDRALTEAEAAFSAYAAAEPSQRAALLDAIAGEIMALGDDLLGTTDAETGLGQVRLTGERLRTVNQLRLFAEVVREGSWADARIETADPARKPPKPDMRRLLIPLGPVGVFSASNFPYAFSVAGGDTASALAAGNPVVVKAHPAHPRTSDMVAGAVRAAVERCGFPAGVFSLIHGGPDVGVALVQHPLTRAVGFTGSLHAGRILFDVACARPEPIPFYGEMGSLNPVFVLPGALAERGAAIGAALADSATMGVGQFCTKPGLIFALGGAGWEELTQALRERIAAKEAARMLYPDLAARFRQGADTLAATAGVTSLAQAPAGADAATGRPAAWLVGVDAFLRQPALREELFGPSTIVVRADSAGQLLEAAKALAGQLTATVHGNEADLAAARPLLALLQRKAGRLVFNGIPTGLDVNAATNHGGPYPATTDVRTTSVGTAAMLRFARPVTYQDAASSVLPAELRDINERGIWRLVNGRMTRDNV
jgi:alpha-ketoglutaric semialdehyde dehydrogenase